jgi:hypothetical protein
MRRIYITDRPYPADAATVAAATATGATEIVHGITPALSIVGIATFGYHELADPPPPPPPAPTADERLDAARQALDAVANLTGPVLAADVADVLADLRTALED